MENGTDGSSEDDPGGREDDPEEQMDGCRGEDGRAASEDNTGAHGDGAAGGARSPVERSTPTALSEDQQPPAASGGDLAVPGVGSGPPEPEPEPESEWDALEDGAAPTSADWCCSPTEPRPAAAESGWCPVPGDDGGSPATDDAPSATDDVPPPPDDFTLAASAGRQPVELAPGGCGYVWSVAAAGRLRQLGVPGQLAGGLPRAPRQTTHLGLPLALLPEETALLHSQGLAELVRYPELLSPRCADQRRLLDQHEAASTAAQQRLMTLARHKQLLERADMIVDGKWRKLERLRASGKPAPDTSKLQLRFEFIEQLRRSVKPPAAEQCYQQLYCGHPLALRAEPAELPQPEGRTGLVRRAVYADLWRRGYWLTDGLKFGGDFLAYEGDPLVFHAVFVVHCVSRRPHVRDLAGMQRLARGCGKTLLLSWMEDGEVRHEAVSRRRRPLREVLPERREREQSGERTDGGEERDGRTECRQEVDSVRSVAEGDRAVSVREGVGPSDWEPAAISPASQADS